MSEALLSVRNLSVDFSTYGQVNHVLKDVSLDVPVHRHVAVGGESGSGRPSWRTDRGGFSVGAAPGPLDDSEP